jgi:DNA-binding MarR family transcriptional regulator/GNAT superfamily N-acetyltransferase
VGGGAVNAERVGRVRAFNRCYTQVIGILSESYLHTRWNVSEARVIFELARRGGVDTAILRRDLGLDSGYLSRIVARLQREGLVVCERSPLDGRRQILSLTAAGRKEFSQLDRRSSKDIRALLSQHPDRVQLRLLDAMDTIRAVLGPEVNRRAVVLRTPAAGDFGWVVARHGGLYAEEYGWNQSFEALVARIVADYLDTRELDREAAWIAEVAGEPAGCVFCVRRDDQTAQLRLLLVEPHARGLGVGSALAERCVAFARDAGYRQLVLWTNDVLVDARRLYERAGFQLVKEEAHHSFGADLVGQNWSLDLTPS